MLESLTGKLGKFRPARNILSACLRLSSERQGFALCQIFIFIFNPLLMSFLLGFLAAYCRKLIFLIVVSNQREKIKKKPPHHFRVLLAFIYSCCCFCSWHSASSTSPEMTLHKIFILSKPCCEHYPVLPEFAFSIHSYDSIGGALLSLSSPPALYERAQS